MNMTSIAHTTTAPKAFYCWYHDRHGVLSKTEGEYVFMDSDTDELTIIEPRDFPWIAMAGELGLIAAAKTIDDARDAIRRKLERCNGCGLIGCLGDASCEAPQLTLLAVA
jgi:hypothetical protein